MSKTLSRRWNELRRFLAADTAQFVGGSALIEPLGMLAVEMESRRARQPGFRP